MAKRRPEPDIAPAVTLGTAAAEQILAIVKRHANVRFPNSQDRDFLIAELANLVPTADGPVVEPGPRSVEAAGAFQQQEGDTGENGAADE